MAIELIPNESRSTSLPIPILRNRPASVQPPITPPLSPSSSSSYPPTGNHNAHALLYSLLTPPLFSLRGAKRRSIPSRHRQHALLCPETSFDEAMELEWAWQPDYCCGRNRIGGSFDILGDEGEESVNEEDVKEDEEDIIMDDQCTFINGTCQQDNTPLNSRLSHGSIRWLRQRVPEHTLRYIESLIHDLHNTIPNDTISKDDKVGVLHLPSPFHRAILHAVCRWWGARSKSEYRRDIHANGNHVVIEDGGKGGVLSNGNETSSHSSLHRVTVIRRGRVPSILLSDHIFKCTTSGRGMEGEG